MLRKLSFIILALLFTMSINAQFKKGDRMLGASVGSAFLNSSNADLSTTLGTSTTNNNNFGLSFSPSIGWFISNNVVIGVMPTVGYTKEKVVGKSSGGSTYLKQDNNQFNVGVGGFARYYFNGSSPMRFFGEYDLSLGLSGTKTGGFQYETYGVYVDRYNQKSSGDFFARTGLAFGLSKFISDHTSLDFYVGYKFSYTNSSPTGTFFRDYSDPGTGDVTTKIDYTQKLTAHNVVLGVGFQVFLGRKKQ